VIWEGGENRIDWKWLSVNWIVILGERGEQNWLKLFYNCIIIRRKKEKNIQRKEQKKYKKVNGRCEKLLLFVSREYNMITNHSWIEWFKAAWNNIDIFSIWVLENLETMKTWNSIFTETKPYFTLLVGLLIKMWNTNKRWRTVGYEANSSNL